MERGGEVDSKERRGRVQRWLADATFYNREEGPTKDLLAGEREREREENLCEDSHKFWQVVLLAMKNQNFSFQAPPSFFRVSRNEARRSKLVQRKTRQGSSRREKTRRSVSNSTIISCVGPEIASKIEGARRERGDANRSSFFSFSPLDASEPRQISPLFISSPSALLF